MLGHATFCIVVVYNNAVARFRRTSGSLIEASMDLGADGFQTFRHVILPNIGTALLAGGMLAFALSFDEVIVTTFTAGQQQTAADLDAGGTDPAAPAPGHQCRRHGRRAGDAAAHPAAYYLTRDGDQIAGRANETANGSSECDRGSTVKALAIATRSDRERLPWTPRC